MWESIHLFSRYSKKYSVSSTSSLENTVSAYTTVNEAADSMTVIIVNRDMSSTRNVTVNLNGYTVNDGNYSTLQLASLPSTETFISHTNNALKKNSVAITSNSFTLAVPKLSTTAVILKSTPTGISEHKNQADEIKVFPNPANDQLRIRINRSQDYNSSLYQSQYYTLLNSLGQTISVGNLQPEAYEHTINTSSLTGGLYFIKIGNKMQKFTIQH